MITSAMCTPALDQLLSIGSTQEESHVPKSVAAHFDQTQEDTELAVLCGILKRTAGKVFCTRPRFPYQQFQEVDLGIALYFPTFAKMLFQNLSPKLSDFLVEHLRR